MPSPTIERLLGLQEKDIRRLGLETQLRNLPREVAAVEARIASEKAAIDSARNELRELESRRKLIETEVGSAEGQLGKYKTQQLGVRKNDEYQALGHEIENVQKQIGELEGRELEAMYAIDEAKKRFAAAEAVLKANITGHEGRIRLLKDREATDAAELATARAEVAQARSGVGEIALEVYDKAATKGMPAVVPIRGSKCGGCHLKVSSDVESAARGKGPEEFPLCDQCGRLVYWES